MTFSDHPWHLATITYHSHNLHFRHWFSSFFLLDGGRPARCHRFLDAIARALDVHTRKHTPSPGTWAHRRRQYKYNTQLKSALPRIGPHTAPIRLPRCRYRFRSLSAVLVFYSRHANAKKHVWVHAPGILPLLPRALLCLTLGPAC